MKLVLGATGNVGSALVRTLAEQGQKVRAVVRRDSPPGFGDGVEVVQGDLDDATTLVPHLRGVDGIFFLSGYQGTPGLLAAAADEGVQHVALLSASSAASTASEGNAVAAYHRETEDQIRGSDLAWTVLRPMSFMSNTLRWRDQVLAGDPVVEPFPAVAAAVVDPADIAAVAATALVRRTQDGQVLTVTGPEPLLPSDRLRMLGKALGRDLELVELTPTQAREQLPAEMPAKYADAFIEFFLDGTLDESTVTSTVAEVTGREPTRYADWIARNVDRFRA